jgi:hypothetical protein
MNWLFDTYSTIYTAAMMQDLKSPNHVADAKERKHVRRSTILGYLARR